MSEKQNEFDTLDDAPQEPSVETPIAEPEQKGSSDEYDFDSAPSETKAPPREDLDGKEVVIENAKIILPRQDVEWQLSKSGKTHLKFCVFKLYYSINNQQEFLAGVRVFKDDNTQNGYSHPAIGTDGKSQASALLCKYASYKEKNPNEIALREFLSFLKSKPKAVLKSVTFTNPVTGTEVSKNMVDKFI